jgi:hypothetical protein
MQFVILHVARKHPFDIFKRVFANLDKKKNKKKDILQYAVYNRIVPATTVFQGPILS